MKLLLLWFSLCLSFLTTVSCNGLYDLYDRYETRTTANQNGDKRKEVSKPKKAIINDDPFMIATHLWPFDSSNHILTTDLISGHKAILANGAKIEKHINESYASTEYTESYIICGDFAGTCFSNPTECIMAGMTISFWLKLNSSYVDDEKDQYIISSGAQSLNSLGFAFLFFHGKFAVMLSEHSRQWNMRIPKKEVPLDTWVNVAFIWDNKRDRLTYYLNGDKKKVVKGEKCNRPKCKYTVLTVGRPNNARDVRYMMPLEMQFLALWDRSLAYSQIKTIYENVKEKRENPNRKR